MVAGNCEDRPGIVQVGLVQLGIVAFRLTPEVDHITQMIEKGCGICLHRVCDSLLLRRTALKITRIPNHMKNKLAHRFNRTHLRWRQNRIQ